MSELLEKTVGQVVSEDYRTAEVFKKYGIDFCCGGKVTVKAICEKKNIDNGALLTDLNIPVAENDDPAKFMHWPLDRLADHIVDRHHRYVGENLEPITQYAVKVARVHGERHPELREIAGLWLDVADELAQHMQKEEHILFPYIRRMQESETSGEPAVKPPFGTVQNPVRMMEQEHENAGSMMHRIAELSSGFTPPEDACNTYRVLFAKLKEFEDDLHTHVHLENNILFPRAAEMEARLFN